MEETKLTALVKKAQAGNSSAMEQLLTYAHITVSYQCRKFMRTPEDAEDMTQEVLLVIYQKLDTLTDPAAFQGWVKRIAATRCMNAVSRTHVELQFAEDEDGNSFIDTIEELDEQKIPDAAIDNAETARMVTELIDALPEAQRICTYLYYYDELSIKEIAELTAATENTVKSRLNYARKAIKEGVLDHEKKGVKLYGLSPLPFLLHFLRSAAQAEANGAAAAACVANVLGANLGTAAATAASTAQAAGSAAAATAGSATGHAAGFLSGKLIAGILAGVVVLGSAAAAVHLVNRHAETVPAFICQHEWQAATCTEPETCHKCGSTDGEALGHTWLDATCEAPLTCANCAATEGEALGHHWIDAACLTPKTCQTCDAVEGEPLGHDMAGANYQQPATCKNCDYTEGEPLAPGFLGNGLTIINAEMGVAYDYTSMCYQNESCKTTGKLTLSDYHIFASADGYEAVDGYEWHSVTISILFNDENAWNYGMTMASFNSNYYQPTPWGVENIINHNGVDYDQYEVIWSDWATDGWDKENKCITYTCVAAWRVPVGYDGYIMGFRDASIEPVDGQYVWEFMPADTLVFKFAYPTA